MPNNNKKLEQKKRAAMAYLSALGHKGSFDQAANDWLAGTPMEVVSVYKPIRQDGSMNYNGIVNAIFEEIDNVDVSKNPQLANAVQSAYRISRGKTSQMGDESGMYEAVEAYPRKAVK